MAKQPGVSIGEPTAKTRQSRARDPAAEWLPLSTLHGWDRNPKRHGETVPKLVRAIIHWGWGPPIEARRENSEIIAGHGRMQAAERLALRWGKASARARSKWHPEAIRVAAGEVPVRYRDLDEDDAHEAAIADNRIGEDSEWDKDLLAEHLEEFEDDADLMGFDDSEIESAIAEDEDTAQSGASKLRDGLTYQVLIQCEGEQHQTRLLERFEQEGLKCKPLIS
jgi:ParB-like chromosome segregation protein Spo0J